MEEDCLRCALACTVEQCSALPPPLGGVCSPPRCIASTSWRGVLPPKTHPQSALPPPLGGVCSPPKCIASTSWRGVLFFSFLFWYPMVLTWLGIVCGMGPMGLMSTHSTKNTIPCSCQVKRRNQNKSSFQAFKVSIAKKPCTHDQPLNPFVGKWGCASDSQEGLHT